MRSTGAVDDTGRQTAGAQPSASVRDSTALDKNVAVEIDNRILHDGLRPGADDSKTIRADDNKNEPRQQTFVGCGELFDNLCQAAIDAAQTATMYLTSNRPRSARSDARDAVFRQLPGRTAALEKKMTRATTDVRKDETLVATRNVMATRCISS
jgi:hypothetical protein